MQKSISTSDVLVIFVKLVIKVKIVLLLIITIMVCIFLTRSTLFDLFKPFVSVFHAIFGPHCSSKSLIHALSVLENFLPLKVDIILFKEKSGLFFHSSPMLQYSVFLAPFVVDSPQIVCVVSAVFVNFSD